MCSAYTVLTTTHGHKLYCTMSTLRNDHGETVARDQGDGSSSSSPVNEKVDELPTASSTGLDRQAQEALHRHNTRAHGTQLICSLSLIYFIALCIHPSTHRLDVKPVVEI